MRLWPFFLPPARSSSFTDSLNGTIDLSSEWILNLGGSLTLQGRTPASQRGQFPESGSVVTLFTAGPDWNLTENLTLGDFSAKLWVEAGKYVAGTGQSTAGAGLKLQYKFTKTFRSWAEVSGQRDVDQSDQITRSAAFAAGAAYRW